MASSIYGNNNGGNTYNNYIPNIVPFILCIILEEERPKRLKNKTKREIFLSWVEWNLK